MMLPVVLWGQRYAHDSRSQLTFYYLTQERKGKADIERVLYNADVVIPEFNNFFSEKTNPPDFLQCTRVCVCVCLCQLD